MEHLTSIVPNSLSIATTIINIKNVGDNIEEIAYVMSGINIALTLVTIFYVIMRQSSFYKLIRDNKGFIKFENLIKKDINKNPLYDTFLAIDIITNLIYSTIVIIYYNEKKQVDQMFRDLSVSVLTLQIVGTAFTFVIKHSDVS